MLEFISNILSRNATKSKTAAKDRLRLILVQDRELISPGTLDAMREDLIKVLSQYMDIDESSLEFNLDKKDSSVALVANIPVLRMKRRQR